MLELRKNIVLFLVPFLLLLSLALPNMANAQNENDQAGGESAEFGPFDLPGKFDGGGESKPYRISEPYYIRNVDGEHQDHILQSHHNWKTITKNDWGHVEGYVRETINNGKAKQYGYTRGKASKVWIKTIEKHGHKIHVTYMLNKGGIYISNGWVN